MFFQKYLDDIRYEILLSNYEVAYLEQFDEDNFLKICKILRDNGYNFIEDIIMNYVELFEIKYKYVDMTLKKLNEYFPDVINRVASRDMTILDKVIEISLEYQDKEEK